MIQCMKYIVLKQTQWNFALKIREKSQIIPGYGFGFVHHIDSFSRLSDFQRFYFLGKKSFQIFYTTKITKKEIKIRRHKDNDVDDFWFVLWNNFLRLNSVCSRTLHPNVLHGQVNRCYCCHCYCCCFCLVKKWNVSFWRARSLNMWVYALCVRKAPAVSLGVYVCTVQNTFHGFVFCQQCGATWSCPAFQWF